MADTTELERVKEMNDAIRAENECLKLEIYKLKKKLEEKCETMKFVFPS